MRSALKSEKFFLFFPAFPMNSISIMRSRYFFTAHLLDSISNLFQVHSPHTQRVCVNWQHDYWHFASYRLPASQLKYLSICEILWHKFLQFTCNCAARRA